MKKFVYVLLIISIVLIGITVGIQQVESAKEKKEKAEIEAMEKSLIDRAKTSYETFIYDGDNDLSDDKFIITSKQIASSILSSKGHNEYIAAYQRAEKNGLADEEVIKNNHQEYLVIIRYLEAVKNVMDYSEAVKESSNNYSTLLTEQQYNELGMNDVPNSTNVREKALTAIDSYKKFVSNNARVQNLEAVYHDTISYVMALHHIQLASSHDLKTDQSITDAENLIGKAASHLQTIVDTTNVHTITQQITDIQNKITSAKQVMEEAKQREIASKNEASKKTEVAKNESKPTSTKTNSKSESKSTETSTSKKTSEVAKTQEKKTESTVSQKQTEKSTATLTSGSVTQFEKEVVRLVNVERSRAGLSALSLDTKLSQVAKMKSEDMRKNNYFSHTSPTYGSPFDMMRKFGVAFVGAGENIAKGQTTPEQVVRDWMNSPGHRANILQGKFSHIGVGHIPSGNYWTQMFIKK